MFNLRRVLVTGANGFVGRALCPLLATRGWRVRRAVRDHAVMGDFAISDIGPDTDWHSAVEGMKCIVHLAARTHVIAGNSRDDVSAYRRINVAGTVDLANMAAHHGVRRFIFVSSIKVNGERTSDHAFTEDSAPAPEDAYGISKLEAELALSQVAKDTELEVVILRPPLIYGPGVKANFLRLMHLSARKIPLPFAAIQNCRSLIYLGNLVDAIAACMEHPAASGKTYLVSDSESVSTPELVRQICGALGVAPRLFRFPSSLLAIGSMLCGRHSEWERLSGSLQVDSSKIGAELDWRPPFTMTQGLAETAQWYHSQYS